MSTAKTEKNRSIISTLARRCFDESNQGGLTMSTQPTAAQAVDFPLPFGLAQLFAGHAFMNELKRPFVLDGNLVAGNGAILIVFENPPAEVINAAQPLSHEETQQRARKLIELARKLLANAVKMVNVQSIGVRKETCQACDGSGRVTNCSECDGGYFTHGSHDYACMNCCESGIIAAASGGDECPECAGSGRFPGGPSTHPGLSAKNALKLTRLQDAEVGHRQFRKDSRLIDVAELPFRFRGGFGLIADFSASPLDRDKSDRQAWEASHV